MTTLDRKHNGKHDGMLLLTIAIDARLFMSIEGVPGSLDLYKYILYLNFLLINVLIFKNVCKPYKSIEYCQSQFQQQLIFCVQSVDCLRNII